MIEVDELVDGPTWSSKNIKVLSLARLKALASRISNHGCVIRAEFRAW
ncbi:MAG: hypothetical protein RL563_2172, partial [Pseudomonadota bacterium]